jgi:hypothetical protein
MEYRRWSVPSEQLPHLLSVQTESMECLDTQLLLFYSTLSACNPKELNQWTFCKELTLNVQGEQLQAQVYMFIPHMQKRAQQLQLRLMNLLQHYLQDYYN